MSFTIFIRWCYTYGETAAEQKAREAGATEREIRGWLKQFHQMMQTE